MIEREQDTHQTNDVSLAKLDTELLKPSATQTHLEYATYKVVFLTKSGAELLKLISIQPDMEYLKFVAQKFNLPGLKIAYASLLKEEEGLIHIEDKTYFNF